MEQPFPPQYPPQYPPPAPEPIQRPRTFGVGAVLGHGFSILFRRLHVFFALTVATSLPLWLVGYLLKPENPVPGELPTMFWVLLVMMIALYAALAVAVIYVVVEEMAGRHASIGNALAMGFKRMLPLILLSLVLMVAYVGVGIVANIIAIALKDVPIVGLPLVLFIFFWFFASVYPAFGTLTVERVGVFGSLGRTLALTKSNRLRIAALLIVQVVIFVLAVLGLVAMLPGVFEGRSYDASNIPTWWTIAAFAVYWLGILGNTIFMAVTYALLRNDKDGVGAGELASVFE
jgi:hypothetical protein